MQFQNYKFRPSSIGKIMTGFDTPNLTEVMERDLSELLAKVTLTEAQAKKRDELTKRRDAEKQLSAGAITYVHDLVDQIYYDYKDFITSKYFDKGII
jgi:ABC-type taurine transport system substrate-binding protein